MHRIVIVGGGIAGIVAATHLRRKLSSEKTVEVLLVDQNRAHVWKPMLHTFAAGTSAYENENISYISHAKQHGYRYWPGVLAGLDRSARQIRLDPHDLPTLGETLPGRSIRYDTLILAIGSRANDFGTPGVAEHCRFIDDIGQARAFNDLLRSRVVQAADRGKELRIIIVGGGATGVELAAELVQHMEILSGYGNEATATKLELILIETASKLLGPFPERISHAVEVKLRQLGVNVMTGTKVVGADAQGVTLDGGRRIDATLVVWAAGVRAPAVTANLDGLELSRAGQVVVKPTLQSASDEVIFATGDCASFPGSNGRPLPATAQVARQQAVFLADSLAAHLRHGTALKEFQFRDMGSLVSLADYAAYGSLGSSGLFRGGFIKGRIAQMSHVALYRMHQLDLNGPVKGALAWLGTDLLRAARPKIRLG